MNIEIANRLVNLRKEHNLSQEALAEKLGISRQAVSKWERAEASPDTDNLILLARLYGISLDELLRTEDEISIPEQETEEYSEQEAWESEQYSDSQDKEEYVHVGFQGVHVKDKDGEVHVGWDGIHVDDRKKGDNVHIDKNGVFVNGEKYDKEWFAHHHHHRFPIALSICIIYMIIGCVFHVWHPGWLLFLLIPIWHSLIEAIEKADCRKFAYPVFATLLFLCIGIFWGFWHPGWVVFLTIPLYYSLVEYFRSLKKNGKKQEEEENE